LISLPLRALPLQPAQPTPRKKPTELTLHSCSVSSVGFFCVRVNLHRSAVVMLDSSEQSARRLEIIKHDIKRFCAPRPDRNCGRASGGFFCVKVVPQGSDVWTPTQLYQRLPLTSISFLSAVFCPGLATHATKCAARSQYAPHCALRWCCRSRVGPRSLI